MSDSLPDPLVPPEVDLRDFGFMPLDVLRLRDSDLAALATGEEFKAAVLLWCVAWHQVPAASLPKDDRLLARFSGAGPGWKKIREEALRGFVECSDGRYYHAVIAEKALESWRAKVAQRERTRAATEAREAKRRAALGQRDDVRDEQRNGARDEQRDVERDVHQGIGTVKGQGQGYLKEKSTAMSGTPDVDLLTPREAPPQTPAAPASGLHAQALEVLAFLNLRTGRDYQPVASNMVLIKARLKEGATVDDMRMVIAKKVRDWTPDDKMREYLRPATLFNATKFAQYRGELVVTTET